MSVHYDQATNTCTITSGSVSFPCEPMAAYFAGVDKGFDRQGHILTGMLSQERREHGDTLRQLHHAQAFSALLTLVLIIRLAVWLLSCLERDEPESEDSQHVWLVWHRDMGYTSYVGTHIEFSSTIFEIWHGELLVFGCPAAEVRRFSLVRDHTTGATA